jgi:hypothetical protein
MSSPPPSADAPAWPIAGGGRALTAIPSMGAMCPRPLIEPRVARAIEPAGLPRELLGP